MTCKTQNSFIFMFHEKLIIARSLKPQSKCKAKIDYDIIIFHIKGCQTSLFKMIFFSVAFFGLMPYEIILLSNGIELI